MHRILFQWRGWKVHSYPAMLYIGLVIGLLCGAYWGGSHGLNTARLSVALLLLVLPALFGARLLYQLAQPLRNAKWCNELFDRRSGGAALFGGLILALVVSVPTLAVLQIPLGAFWDAAAITLLVGMIFTRIGCLLNGCCAGRPSNSPIALKLSNVHGVTCRRIPTQLLECGVAVVLLACSVLAWRRVPFAGALFLANLVAYATARCALETTREIRDWIGPIPLHSAIALALGIPALFMLVAGIVHYQNTASAERAVTHLAAGASTIGSDLGLAHFVITPLAVLGLMSLYRFIGCESFGAAAPQFTYETTPTGEPDYPATILKEKNGTASNVVVAYWRLGESAATPIPGGTAKDETGVHNGTYTKPSNPLGADAQHLSAASNPIKLELGVTPGMLGTQPSATSIRVDGGHIVVPWSATLNPAQFTLEAFVLPEWDLVAMNARGRYHCILESSNSPPANPANQRKKVGFGLYAGPDDPSNPTSPYRWQGWVGTGTEFKQLKEKKPYAHNGSNAGPLVEALPTYIALTFDGTTFTLYVFTQDRDIDHVKYVLEPQPYSPNTSGPGADLSIGIVGARRPMVAPFPGPNRPLYAFDGKIQEVAIYSAGLSEERISSHIAASFKSP